MKDRCQPSPLPVRTWLLPLGALIWNQLLYYGGRRIAWYVPHYDLTMELDSAVPFLPWTVVIYFGCFLFWAISYLIFARQDVPSACRFFAADFLAKAVCFLFFICLPTTNIRPVVAGVTLWDDLMRLLYRIDAPVNLFPSIHCLVSWLCWIGVRRRRSIPGWYRILSFVMAVAVCLSTLTTRQHVLLDVAGGILIAECSYWFTGRAMIRQLCIQLWNRAFIRRQQSDSSVRKSVQADGWHSP